MAVLIVPPLDEEPWPTLGPQIEAFLHECAVFGPGSLKGEPARLDPEKRAALYRAYEIYPRGHEMAGRRRFQRVVLSFRKGVGKCCGVTTPVVMADGTVLPAGKIRRGERKRGSTNDDQMPRAPHRAHATLNSLA